MQNCRENYTTSAEHWTILTTIIYLTQCYVKYCFFYVSPMSNYAYHTYVSLYGNKIELELDFNL